MPFERLIGSGYEAYPAYSRNTNSMYRTHLHYRVSGVAFVDQLKPFFSEYCLRLHPLPTPPPRVRVAVDGAHGLELATHVTDGPTVCIEAAVLYNLIEQHAVGETEPPPLPSASSTFTCGSANGWFGFITGQFFQYASGVETPKIAGAVLQDRYGHLMWGHCPRKAIDAVSDILQHNDWDGAPDITMWNRTGDLILVEVKTERDRLSDVQKRVLTSARAHAQCKIVKAIYSQ